MKQNISFIIVFLIICAVEVSTTQSICHKIMDGTEGSGVSIEEINRCYECGGWYEVNEESTVSILLTGRPTHGTTGFSWCAAEINDILEITFQQTIKLAGFGIFSSSEIEVENTLEVFYGNDRDHVSQAKHSTFSEALEATWKIRRFSVPLSSSFIKVNITSRQISQCYTIKFYSCDEILSLSTNGFKNSPLYAEIVSDNQTDCPPCECDLNSAIFLPDDKGCEICVCDIGSADFIEGDIIIDSLSRYNINTEYGKVEVPPNAMQDGLIGDQYRWYDYRQGDNYIIPYVIESSVTEAGRLAIPVALRKIEQVTCLRFEERTTHDYFLSFFRGQGCYSYVGNVRPPPQQGQKISVGRGCEHEGIIQHEVMHAIGFWHEQSRSDRDEFVEILHENILAGREKNFKKRETIPFGSPYDYKSLMHYGNKAFSANGKDTIRAKGRDRTVLGQRNGLSDEDIKQINSMYKCFKSATASSIVSTSTSSIPRPTSTITSKPNTKSKETATVTPPVSPPDCRNTHSDKDCQIWQRLGYCEIKFYRNYMEKNCAKACEKCDRNCEDRSSRCRQNMWQCTSSNWERRQDMVRYCPRTCGTC